MTSMVVKLNNGLTEEQKNKLEYVVDYAYGVTPLDESKFDQAVKVVEDVVSDKEQSVFIANSIKKLMHGFSHYRISVRKIVDSVLQGQVVGQS